MDFKPIVQELGIDKLPEDQQEIVLADIFQTLELRMSMRMTQDLSEEQRQQLEEALKNGDEAAMAKLQEVYPNIREAYQEELTQIKDDIKAILPQQ